MSSLQTSYEFTLPRGYVDDAGQLHRTGTMRLATARDELEPLRDPRVDGPDDPRLTILVLSRVVESLGTLDQVNPYVIEGLFAVDLAFLQDFYGVINFGSQEEYDALVNAQASSDLLGVVAPAPAGAGAAAEDSGSAGSAGSAEEATPDAPEPGPRPNLRRAVEEIPRRQQ